MSRAKNAKKAPTIKRQSNMIVNIFDNDNSPPIRDRDPVSVIDITVAIEKSIIQRIRVGIAFIVNGIIDHFIYL